MKNNKRIFALIPARGGSKGIPKKNIKPLAGKPLIAYSIEAALGSKYIDKAIVSTDSEEIAHTALHYGADVPFLRPAEYASDQSKTIDAVIHAVKTLRENGDGFDVLVLLQPTQPLRTAEDIDASIELYFERGETSLVSVSAVKDHPVLIRSIDANGELIPLLHQSSSVRRQDMPPFYRVNGCIYINAVSEIDESLSFNDNRQPYIMPACRAVDIDTMDDFCEAERLINKSRSSQQP